MVFLFQGDSITDAGRVNYDSPKEQGFGYVRILASELTYLHGDYEVLNTGVSGNRVTDLLTRWRKDCLDLLPDVLTILIGVNDVWHEINARNGVAPGLFEEVYDILLREVRAELPDTRIILMGAYVLHGTATDPHWDYFEREVGIRREITQRLAKKYGADYLDLQEKFDEAAKRADAGHFLMDGVHPTAAGHRLIAEEWLQIYG